MSNKAIEVCKNIMKTLKSLEKKKIKSNEISDYRNKMFNKPTLHGGMLKRKLNELMLEYNINKKDLK